MKNIFQKFLILIIIFPPKTTFAGDRLTSTDEFSVSSPGTVYISGNQIESVMISVSVWGEVEKPGLHHVPVGSSLEQVLTYAGGPTKTADVERLVLKRERTDGKYKIIDVNLEDLLADSGKKGPRMAANDIVWIAKEKPIISDNTVKVIAIVSSFLGIVVSGFVIANQLNK